MRKRRRNEGKGEELGKTLWAAKFPSFQIRDRN
jgi:hypothetical protein